MGLSGASRLDNLSNPSIGDASGIRSSDAVPEILDITDPAVAMMSLFADPMMTDPNQDLHEMEREGFAPESMPPALNFTLDEIEEAMVRICEDAMDAAIAVNYETKIKWRMFRDMADGIPPGDDANDPLVQLGYWVALLQRFSDVYGAIELISLIPDPSEYDFFEIVPKQEWAGLEKYAEAITNWLRSKIKQMAPETANGFLDVLNDLLTDKRNLGNSLAVVTHEVFSDFDVSDNGDGLIEGPAVAYLDPIVVYPERIDVGSLTQTGTCIIEPVAVDDIYKMGFKNVERVIAENHPEAMLMQGNINNQPMYVVPGSVNRNMVEETMLMFDRRVRFVKWPGWAIRRALKITEEDYTPEQIELIDKAIQALLATKYEFDPSKTNHGTWWDIEWCDQILVQCRPYPLALPVGKGPIVHHKMFSKPGQLWGHGFWDRCQMDERFYNFLRRAIVKCVGFASDPPFEIDYSAYDPDFLEVFGDQLRLEPGMALRRNSRMDKNAPAIAPLEMNERALPFMREEINALFGEMRLMTGVTEQLEGTGTNETATENANNLQQSSMGVNFQIRRDENGLLKEIIERMYVIAHQAMKMLGVGELVSVSNEQMGLQALELKPEDVIALSLVTIRMTGSTSPANKQNQIANFDKFVQTWLPTGALDIMECIKANATMLGISGAQRLIFNQDPMMAQAVAGNLVTAFGTAGLSQLSPLMQQSLGMSPMGMQAGGSAGPVPSGQQGGAPINAGTQPAQARPGSPGEGQLAVA